MITTRYYVNKTTGSPLTSVRQTAARCRNKHTEFRNRCNELQCMMRVICVMSRRNEAYRLKTTTF